MSMIAGSVSVDSSGNVTYLPNGNANTAAGLLYIALNGAGLTNGPPPTATPTNPTVGKDPTTGQPFTNGTTVLVGSVLAGDNTIIVSSAFNLAVGSNLSFIDNPESVIINSTYITNSTTVPLKSALQNSHSSGTNISYFTSLLVPGSVKVQNLPFVINPDGSTTPIPPDPSAPPSVSMMQSNAKLATALAAWMVSYLTTYATISAVVGSVTGTTDTTVSNTDEPLKNGTLSGGIIS